jgi:sorbin and SH3 domain containing protein 1
VQKVEKSEDRKLVQLSPRQYDGIGPTTKDGMPLILRSVSLFFQVYSGKILICVLSKQGVKEENYGKWYKRMYDSLHKAGRDGEHLFLNV